MNTLSRNTDLIVIDSSDEGIGFERDNDNLYFLDPCNKREDARFLLDLPLTYYPTNPVIEEDVLRRWFRSIGELEKCFATQQKWYKDWFDN